MKLSVSCPKCSVKGFINVSEDAVTKAQRGLVAINIARNTVCEHSFVAYVDKNFKVRDCFIADFNIEISEVSQVKEIGTEGGINIDLIDIDLVKLNFPAELITYTLRGIFLNKQIIILSDLTHLFDNFSNFFKFITQNSFNIDVSFFTNEEYQKNKKQYKLYIVLKGKDVFYDAESAIDLKKLKEEKTIVQKFFDEKDLKSSLIIIKNEMQKIFEMAKTIANFVKENKSKAITSKVIMDTLSEIYPNKISLVYANFLIEIVENYFKINVPKDSEVSNFLSFF